MADRLDQIRSDQLEEGQCITHGVGIEGTNSASGRTPLPSPDRRLVSPLATFMRSSSQETRADKACLDWIRIYQLIFKSVFYSSKVASLVVPSS